MAKCHRCGAKTELYDNGTPVCIACVDLKSDPSSNANALVNFLSKKMGLRVFVLHPSEDTASES